MRNTLYELLEISTTASQESIAASYQRLHTQYAALQSSSESEDATNRLIALREAYSTLSNAERRKAYDEKLAARAAIEVVEETQPRSYFKVLLLVAVIAVSSLGYARYQAKREQAILEKEKAAAAVKLAEIEAKREESERQAARLAEYQRKQDEAQQRYQRERDIAYGQQISRSIQRAEAMALQEKQREEQQRQYEAERRLAQEKAVLRRMEAENGRFSRY